MISFNLTDWYWVAADKRVYSSARQVIVDDTDAGYLGWVAAGNVATFWPHDDAGQQTTAALQRVFDNAGVQVFADLATYANSKQWALATGGYALTLSGQALTFSTDTASQSLITGKYVRFAQPNPPTTVSWQFASGFVSLSAADFQKAAVAIADFIQATFDTLQAVFAAIAAGTITTAAQIDAAAWPSAIAPTS